MSDTVRVRFRDPGSHASGPTPTQGTQVFLIGEDGKHHEIEVTAVVLMAKPNNVWQAVLTVPVEVEGEVTAEVLDKVVDQS